ncbi:MAG: ABC transporter permease [Clostridiales Family XIII bacterium]|jgi:NitT/TauT family transport system permease protein|nr:ABC transporter permease [Clostridiales Family XIII bacterium]
MNKIVKLRNSIGRFAFNSLSTLLLFVLWEIASLTVLKDNGILPDPITIIVDLWGVLTTTDYITQHLFPSVRRALTGFALAVVVGLFLAFTLSTFAKALKPAIVPILRFFEKINPIALFPVFMLLLGIGELSKVLIIFWVVVWTITFYAIDGLSDVDNNLIESAKSMGAGKIEVFRKVYIPAALPIIFHGIKFAASMSFLFLISVEMLSSSRGIGWYLVAAKNEYNLPHLYGTVILVAIIGIIISEGLGNIEKVLFPWKQQLEY